MARILYGIHGTGHGHAMRGLTLARALPQHEFLFICADDAVKVLEPEFKTARIPNLGTVFKNYKVDIGATIRKGAPILARRGEILRDTLKILEDFKPDACLVDLEYFTPLAAREAGIPCMALDHQHIITCCRHDLPPDMFWDTAIQGLTPRWLFSPQQANLLISFYAPPALSRWNSLVAPPILREKVLSLSPADEGHILVYQSNSTDRRLIDFLINSTKRKAYVFGYNASGQSGNIIFRPKSEEEFLRLLEGCAYVIQGGSHTLMSEALYLGKPVLSIPLAAMLEQRFNALYLERLGYGRQTSMAALNPALLDSFEEDLHMYRENMARANFLGNDLVFDIVDKFATSGKLPDFGKK